jgi:hypothetical protein
MVKLFARLYQKQEFSLLNHFQFLKPSQLS